MISLIFFSIFSGYISFLMVISSLLTWGFLGSSSSLVCVALLFVCFGFCVLTMEAEIMDLNSFFFSNIETKHY